MAQDAVIREDDCGTTNGVMVEEIVESGNITSPLTERILGRTPVQDIIDERDQIIVKAGDIISEIHLESIAKLELRSIKIRSVPLSIPQFIGASLKNQILSTIFLQYLSFFKNHLTKNSN